jgi:hypothetical protein
LIARDDCKAGSSVEKKKSLSTRGLRSTRLVISNHTERVETATRTQNALLAQSALLTPNAVRRGNFESILGV